MQGVQGPEVAAVLADASRVGPAMALLQRAEERLQADTADLDAVAAAAATAREVLTEVEGILATMVEQVPPPTAGAALDSATIPERMAASAALLTDLQAANVVLLRQLGTLQHVWEPADAWRSACVRR